MFFTLDMRVVIKYIWYRKIRKDKTIYKFSIDEITNTVSVYDLVDEKILENEEKIYMYKKIQTLDEETRNIMYLRILGNLTYDEISEIIGKSVNYIRVKFFRGKEKIIKEKKDYE